MDDHTLQVAPDVAPPPRDWSTVAQLLVDATHPPADPAHTHYVVLNLHEFQAQQALKQYLRLHDVSTYTQAADAPEALRPLMVLLANHGNDRVVVVHDGTHQVAVAAVGGFHLDAEVDALGLAGMVETYLDPAPGSGLWLYDGVLRGGFASYGGEEEYEVHFEGDWRRATVHDLAPMDLDVEYWQHVPTDLGDVNVAAANAALRWQFPDKTFTDDDPQADGSPNA